MLIAGNIGRIDALYVSKHDRRRGVAQALVGRILETCARSLLKHVVLAAPENDLPTLSLFQKFGFERVGVQDSYRTLTPVCVANGSRGKFRHRHSRADDASSLAGN